MLALYPKFYCFCFSKKELYVEIFTRQVIYMHVVLFYAYVPSPNNPEINLNLVKLILYTRKETNCTLQKFLLFSYQTFPRFLIMLSFYTVNNTR
jgi:hypothetical protein